MAERVIVYRPPFASNKGADKKQQGALGLVEIGDEHVHNVIFVAWSNNDLRAAMERVQLVAVEPCEQMLKGFNSCERGLSFVGCPLADVKLLLAGIRVQT